MLAPLTKYITVTPSLGSVTINLTKLYSRYVLQTNGIVTLTQSITISSSGTPFDGQTLEFYLPGTIVLSSHSLTILGTDITASQALVRGIAVFRWNASGAGQWEQVLAPNFSQTNWLDGTTVKDGTLSISKLLSTVTSGILRITGGAYQAFSEAAVANKILIGDGTNVTAASTDASSDVEASLSGSNLRLMIGDEKIVNSQISPAAQIERSKLKDGTANHVLINDGSGEMSSESALNVSRGGTGLNNSAATGVQKYASGTPNVSLVLNADIDTDQISPSRLTQDARFEVLNFCVSFEANEQCNNQFKIPFKGQVVEVYASVTKALSATDDGTITMKNGAGTTMTNGTLTFPSSSALNTAQTIIPTGDNTFNAGDVLQAVTLKTTAGGRALLSIKVERLD